VEMLIRFLKKHIRLWLPDVVAGSDHQCFDKKKIYTMCQKFCVDGSKKIANLK